MTGQWQPRPARALIPVLLIVALLGAAHGAGQEGGFSVDPVPVFLDAGRSTEMVRISNDSDTPLALQVRVYRWTQDDDGADIYEETEEVIYFPRILTVESQQQRVVRIGLEIPVAAVEGTYRLYLEELPEDSPADASGVRTLMRVGIPIFRVPESEVFEGALEGIEWNDCRLSFRVLNRGNSHFVVQRVGVVATDESGAVMFDEETSGWYVLPGAGRLHEFDLAPHECSSVARLEIAVTTDKGDLAEAKDVVP